MKNLVLIGFVVAGAMACSSSGEEEIQETVAASEETEAAKPEEKSAEAKPTEEAHSESEMALIDAQATVATEQSDKKEEAAEEKTAEVEKSEKIVYPTASLVNLRQGPGMSHSVTRVASFGEGIALSGESHALWLKTTDGLWVSKGFVSAEKPEKAIDPEMPKSAPSTAVSEVTQETSDEGIAAE